MNSIIKEPNIKLEYVDLSEETTFFYLLVNDASVCVPVCNFCGEINNIGDEKGKPGVAKKYEANIIKFIYELTGSNKRKVDNYVPIYY